MKLLGFGAVVVFLLAAAAQQQTASQDVVKRVSPDAYSSAPARIRASLKSQHCELPQVPNWARTRLNIVSGHFGNPKQPDWAALCIAPDNSTRVLVFWGKSAPCPAEFHHGRALQGRVPPGQAGDISLGAASVKEILSYRSFFGDSHDNPVNHDGIEVGDGKASIIYYCHGGKWLELQGSD